MLHQAPWSKAFNDYQIIRYLPTNQLETNCLNQPKSAFQAAADIIHG
jgi:hypothetical protein